MRSLFSRIGLKLSKTCTKLSKTSHKPAINQSNGRAISYIQYKPVWDPETQCVLAPLGSPTDLQKRVYEQSVPACRTCTGGVYRVGYGDRVGVPGWLYWVLPSHLLEEVPSTAERAPEALQGLEWVVLGAGRTGLGTAAGTALYHPAGPVGALRAPPCTGPCRMPPHSQ